MKEEKKTFDKTRAVSWSAISAFEYNKEQWYKRYVLGEKSTSPEMEFGSKIGKLLETDPSFLPEIPREKHMEYKLSAKYGKISLTGYIDSFCDKKLVLHEYKTGQKVWDKKRADEHGQIDMYLLILYLSIKVKPEDVKCFIHWMPTKRKENGDFSVEIDFIKGNEFHHFSTSRTTKDILLFGARINRVLKEMEEYCQNHD